MDLETSVTILKALKRSLWAEKGATKIEAAQSGEDLHNFYIPLVRFNNIFKSQDVSWATSSTL